MDNRIISSYVKAIRTGSNANLISVKSSSPQDEKSLSNNKAIILLAKKFNSEETDIPMRNFLLNNSDNFKKPPPTDSRTSHEKTIDCLADSYKSGINPNFSSRLKGEKTMDTIIANIDKSQKRLCELSNNLLLWLQTPDEIVFKLDQYLTPLMKCAYQLDGHLALLPNFLATSKGVPRQKPRSLIGRIRVSLTQAPERERIDFMAKINCLCTLIEAYREKPNAIDLQKIENCVVVIKIDVSRISAKLADQVRQDFDFQSRYPIPLNI
ncbi:hypothetical protein MICAH_7610002 [Microcystis aeruginosa PCC 9809]|jgi:hypothetical protein|uniref:Uncharacterized protein n=1 Tax=Microcystis aeruginosa PCC 9809 TaxID=1160285 RepID=I4I6Z3_MICAE|nr:hypothetical protein [Microcystis aeruginosa]CCI30067.1 hypothetical protein MICAH_7610002 [Microcystis aeruginosa PCC 9809]